MRNTEVWGGAGQAEMNGHMRPDNGHCASVAGEIGELGDEMNEGVSRKRTFLLFHASFEIIFHCHLQMQCVFIIT
ncbi:hypothetical protein RRG08_056026 [Elysia crispata]|uniref:Uncharacterized protein n=1 Tax=Elysia crispata TaxID=231223 RepID=A0AAE1DYT1_9GAST|nr:hypothetical protein RRG08_056026 [Elysia crispata]